VFGSNYLLSEDWVIMEFIETKIKGVFLIKSHAKTDERGFFKRAFCANEFKNKSLESAFVQSNFAQNKEIGVVRGMHYQLNPHEEVKLVSCISGAIYDVVVDVRKDSETYLSYFGAELNDRNGLMMYVPKGFAHGYQTLERKSVVHYMVSNYYAPKFESGIRHNDQKIGIEWPLEVSMVSDKDDSWPLL
jgi:dTDP-4-dehydrorhamnose 3,5-epimerase